MAAGSPCAVAADRWIQIQSPHFTVLTDDDEKRGREVAKRFEQMRSVFAALFFRGKVDAAVPLEIIALRNNKEVRAQSPLFNGKVVEVAGYFQPGVDRNFILLDLSSQNHWIAVFHEYAHLLINSHLQPMPLCFDEGLAEFYSSMDVQGQHVSLGTIPAGYAPFVGHEMMPIERLLAVEPDSKIYNESGNHRSLFYAESWLLVHYLMDHQLIGKLDAYTAERRQGTSMDEALQRAWGMNSQQFDIALRAYVMNRRIRVWSYQVPAEVESFPYTARAVEAPDANAELADLHQHMRDRHEQAMGEFQAVLATKAEQPVAHRGLGYAYLMKHDLERARAEFLRAAAADSADPLVHYYAGSLALRHGAGPGDVAIARKELERATQLNPGMADAFAALGQACARTEEYAAAGAAMQRAIQLDPRNDSYLLEMSRFYTFQRQWTQAEGLLRPLQQSREANIAAAAVDALALITRVKYLPEDEVHISGNHISAVRPAYFVEQMEATASSPESQPEAESDAEPRGQPEPPIALEAPKPRAIHWLQGTLVGVDCSQPPAAVLTIAATERTWRMLASDAKKLLLIGDEPFSCGWKHRKVMVNYREGGSADADLVSVEVQ